MNDSMQQRPTGEITQTPRKGSGPRSPLYYSVGAVLLLIIGFGLGVIWTGVRYPVMKVDNFQYLNAAYMRIMNDYLEGAESEALINGAAQGMVASLGDPYSQYMVGERGEEYTQSYEGEIYGIGVTLRQEEGQYIINEVTKDAPAERGGLLPGDILKKVDGTSLEEVSYHDLIGMVRGKEGEPVSLVLQRPGDSAPLEVTLKREAIAVHTVTYELLDGGVGHVTISRFGYETDEEFKTAIEELEKEGPLQGLLLDLRSNPGGLLESTVEIASMLIPKGEKILDVVSKEEKQTVSYRSYQKEEWGIPIVVLVNGKSASASEVMASALKESAGATVVGEQTFGKGVVQMFKQFPDGSVLSLTEAQWKTPGGTWINKQGVTPDYEVSLPDYAYLRPLAIGSEMKLGSYGEDVKTLQEMLKALGYGPVGEEGIFGGETESALRKYQQDNGLEATGQFNDRTGYSLIDSLRDKLNAEDPQLLEGVKQLKGKK
ncbi:S41 family peptidase [Paenibacillus sp. J5C_2022]|uniref:S41 family peptidase n=1 Tax=Paenibacillus sp. J5C2022 TaxID=2977129 RepID=UPI0021CEC00D|nr:S41 family peptidase [Paenibacillus sp. J5C2022]MCU6710881.1 S41 family peptidase [Paenibacillus sp. J5C2022]